MASRAPALAMQGDKNVFLQQLGDYFDKCRKGEEDRCMADIQFLAKLVTSKVERVSQDPSGVSHFVSAQPPSKKQKTSEEHTTSEQHITSEENTTSEKHTTSEDQTIHDKQANRDKVIAKFYERLDEEANEKMTVSADNAADAYHATIWALLQTCSDDKLDTIKNQLENEEEIPEYYTTARKIIDDWGMLHKIFFPHTMSKQQKAVVALADATASKQKRTTPTDNCKKRDGDRCVVTKEKNPVVCHIFPHSALKKPETTRSALTLMWAKIPADDVYKKLFQKKVIDKLGNLICLSPSLHHAWGRGEFALKHLETDQKDGRWFTKLGFYWMKKVQANSGNYRSSAHKFLADLPRLPLPVRVFNVETNSPVIDGDVITIWADTEEELPDPDLIGVQWDIIRMASICGGADPKEEEESDDDDEMVDMVPSAEFSSTGQEA